MCGLVGVIGDIGYADKKMFDYMLKLDVVRGPHSTGVARINKKTGVVDMVKAVGTTWDLIESKPDEYYNNKTTTNLDGDFTALIGHNRWATVGKINEDNAHPFASGPITGCHNGTLEQFSLRKLDDYQHYGTDSECIIFNIEVKGAAETIAKLSGAWALTWFNSDTNSFNVVRNKERPLYFAHSACGKTLYYASEHWMIYQAAEKYRIKLKEDKVWGFESNIHYEFTLNAKGELDADSMTKTEMKGFVAPPFNYNRGVMSSTVVPFKAKNSESVSVTSYEYWHARIGEVVEFEVMDKCESAIKGGPVYYKAQVNDPTRAEIRIYPSGKVDIEATIGAIDAEIFIGRVKKVKRVNGKAYIILDPKSITIYTFKQNELWDDLLAARPDLGVYEGASYPIKTPKGEVLPSEFEKMMSCGCSWCTHEPSVSEHKTIKWMNDKDFLCTDCSADEEVMQYVSQYATTFYA